MVCREVKIVRQNEYLIRNKFPIMYQEECVGHDNANMIVIDDDDAPPPNFTVETNYDTVASKGHITQSMQCSQYAFLNSLPDHKRHKSLQETLLSTASPSSIQPSLPLGKCNVSDVKREDTICRRDIVTGDSYHKTEILVRVKPLAKGSKIRKFFESNCAHLKLRSDKSGNNSPNETPREQLNTGSGNKRSISRSLLKELPIHAVYVGVDVSKRPGFCASRQKSLSVMSSHPGLICATTCARDLENHTGQCSKSVIGSQLVGESVKPFQPITMTRGETADPRRQASPDVYNIDTTGNILTSGPVVTTTSTKPVKSLTRMVSAFPIQREAYKDGDKYVKVTSHDRKWDSRICSESPDRKWQSFSILAGTKRTELISVADVQGVCTKVRSTGLSAASKTIPCGTNTAIEFQESITDVNGEEHFPASVTLAESLQTVVLLNQQKNQYSLSTDSMLCPAGTKYTFSKSDPRSKETISKLKTEEYELSLLLRNHVKKTSILKHPRRKNRTINTINTKETQTSIIDTCEPKHIYEPKGIETKQSSRKCEGNTLECKHRIPEASKWNRQQKEPDIVNVPEEACSSVEMNSHRSRTLPERIVNVRLNYPDITDRKSHRDGLVSDVGDPAVVVPPISNLLEAFDLQRKQSSSAASSVQKNVPSSEECFKIVDKVMYAGGAQIATINGLATAKTTVFSIYFTSHDDLIKTRGIPANQPTFLSFDARNIISIIQTSRMCSGIYLVQPTGIVKEDSRIRDIYTESAFLIPYTASLPVPRDTLCMVVGPLEDDYCVSFDLANLLPQDSSADEVVQHFIGKQECRCFSVLDSDSMWTQSYPGRRSLSERELAIHRSHVQVFSCKCLECHPARRRRDRKGKKKLARGGGSDDAEGVTAELDVECSNQTTSPHSDDSIINALGLRQKDTHDDIMHTLHKRNSEFPHNTIPVKKQKVCSPPGDVTVTRSRWC